MTMTRTTKVSAIPHPSPQHFRVAIVGGGLSGACAATSLANCATSDACTISIDVFDQGRSGVGGRTSTRVVVADAPSSSFSTEHGDDDVSMSSQNPIAATRTMRWDHGCQFLRADTPRFRSTVQEWIRRGWAAEYAPKSYDAPGADFFGSGGSGCGGPFFVGVGGMRCLVDAVLTDLTDLTESGEADTGGGRVRVFRGTRVAKLERRDTKCSTDEEDDDDNDECQRTKWILHGVDGEAAFHDAPECIAATTPSTVLGRTATAHGEDGYDAVVLTDLSSSFGGWHRASAGVPDAFAQTVRRRAGARVPLFTAMLAFETRFPVVFDTLTFGDDGEEGDGLWFAARTSSKPGTTEDTENNTLDCWTLVSTPEYALRHITATPMQAPDGTFLPQTPEVLTDHAVNLDLAFRRAVVANTALTGGRSVEAVDLPPTFYRDAQRWGSALRAHPSSHRPVGDETGGATPECGTEVEVMGVSYDVHRGCLGPTTVATDAVGCSFVVDPLGSMLFQAGDMVSGHTPGAEGAVISGMDCGRHVHAALVEMAVGRQSGL